MSSLLSSIALLSVSLRTAYSQNCNDWGFNVLSWDELFADETELKSNITLTEGINGNGLLTVTVDVVSRYIYGATYEAYETFYQPDEFFGVTYLLDTNEFMTEGRLLEDANPCENRLESSYIGQDFVDDYWTYTTEPGVVGNLGNDDYLEYGDQNIWDISYTSLSNNPNYSTCGNVKWTNTFTFLELLNDCKDANGVPSYEVTETDGNITFNMDFYFHVVSPNPIYLMGCNDVNNTADCGQYLVKTLITHPLFIIFSKRNQIINNKDDVRIQLFTINIIGAVFIEETDVDGTANDEPATFTLTLLTSVPNFMALNGSTARILKPESAELISNNGGIPFIDLYGITELTDSYPVDGDCLIQTSNRCFQKWEISIEINQCPDDGLEFDGNYSFAADFNCIGNQTTCDEYTSDEPLQITLGDALLDYTELCDETLYEIEWNGTMSFYEDDTFTTTQSEFQIGETVYVRINVSRNIDSYEIFGVRVIQCFICTADIDDSDSSETIDTCEGPNVDQGLFYTFPDDSGLFPDLLGGGSPKTYEDFSFVLPALADNVFFVDCTVELELTINNPTRRRRERMLLQNERTGNVYQQYSNSGTVEPQDITDNNNNEEPTNNNNNNDDNDELLSTILIVIGGIIIVLMIVIFYLLYRNKQKANDETLNAALEIVKKNKLQSHSNLVSADAATNVTIKTKE